MTIRLASVRDVRDFVSLATTQPYSVLVADGDRFVNATSFMEMCTLDFTEPLQLRIAEENRENFRLAAEKFIAG